MKKRINMYCTQHGYYELYNRHRNEDVFICTDKLNEYFDIIEDRRYVNKITIVISDKHFEESYPIEIKLSDEYDQASRCEISCEIMGEPVYVISETVEYFIDRLKLEYDKTYYVGVEL